MSSLIETSKKEEVPVSDVQTVSGRSLNTHVLPKRHWSGYSLVNFTTNSNGETAVSSSPRLIRCPRIRPKLKRNCGTTSMTTTLPSDNNNTEKTNDEKQQQQHGFQEFMALLAERERKEEAEERDGNLAVDNNTISDKHIDDLLTMMREQTQIPTEQQQQEESDDGRSSRTCQKRGTSPPIDYTLEGRESSNGNAFFEAAITNSSGSNNTTQSSNSKSVSGSTSLASYNAPRPSFFPTNNVTDGGKQYYNNKAHTPHPLSKSITFPTEENQEEDDDDEYGSEEETKKVIMGGTTLDPSKYPHLQNRKILPLPKPRWKRNAAINKQKTDGTSESAANNNNSVKQDQPTTTTTTTTTTNVTSSIGGIPAFAPYVWQFTPPARELQRTYLQAVSAEINDSSDDDFGIGRLTLSSEDDEHESACFGLLDMKDILLEHELQGGRDANHRDNAKKMKRSAGTTTAATADLLVLEEKKSSILRRKDRNRWRSSATTVTAAAEDRTTGNSDSKPTSSSSFPQGAFNFSMDARTRERLKALPKFEDLPLSTTKSTIGLSDVLRQTMPLMQGRPPPMSSPSISKKGDELQRVVDYGKHSVNTAHMNNNPPTNAQRPVDNKKKKGKPADRDKTGSSSSSTTSSSAAATSSSSATTTTTTTTTGSNNSRRRKGQQKAKKKAGAAAEDQSSSINVLASDVALVKSPDPDEWICVFCQYEIFCRGLEAARRKGGYYRRKRERQRRLREAEARRNGEVISSNSESEEQQHLTPPSQNNSNLSVDRSLRRGNRAA